MIVTTSWISSNYNKFNQLYFGGTLPSIKFSTNHSKRVWGFATFRYDWDNDTIIPDSITISNYYDSPENIKIQILLHEMIHIEDYTWHPEHFIKNGRRVTKHTYDAHGSWFSDEARRISEESGYVITNRVTREEVNSSSFSIRTKRNIENKTNAALVCAVTGDNGVVFYFKTDIYKAPKLRGILMEMYWLRFNTIKSIKFYKINDSRLAMMRSCFTKIKGWYMDRISFRNRLIDLKATEIYI